MLSAIITSNYISGQSLQKGFEASNLQTLIYQTDFSITDHYDFVYHDGFLVHLVSPTEQHLNFCLHLKNLLPGGNILVLMENVDVEIQNMFSESMETPIFLSPFPFRKIVNIYESTVVSDLDRCQLFEVGGVQIELDPTTRVLRMGGSNEIKLINKEFFMMKFLLANQGRIVSKIDLFEYVWGKNLMGDIHTVDVHMSRLRKKIKEYSNSGLIRTIHCAGYVLG
jgi:DNA-binding response OmpR family regulator